MDNGLGLAGAYMSYLIPPVLSGLSGNVAGNLMDDELTSRLGYVTLLTQRRRHFYPPKYP